MTMQLAQLTEAWTPTSADYRIFKRGLNLIVVLPLAIVATKVFSEIAQGWKLKHENFNYFNFN